MNIKTKVFDVTFKSGIAKWTQQITVVAGKDPETELANRCEDWSATIIKCKPVK